MPKDVFVCYASEDTAIADAVCATLEKKGISCWIAPRDVLPSRDYGEAILQAISECSLMVLVLTAKSSGSEHVKNEVEQAVSARKQIVPLRVEKVIPTGSLKLHLSRRQWLDASTPPLEKHLERLGQIIESLVHPDQPPVPPGLSDVEVEQVSEPETTDDGRRRRKLSGSMYGMLLFAVCVVIGVLLILRPWVGESPVPESEPAEQRIAAARQHLSEGRYPEALLGFKSVLDDDPGNPEARLGFAMALRLEGKIDEAITELLQAAALGDADAEVYLRLGEALEEKGDTGRALFYYRRYLSMAPGGSDHDRIASLVKELEPEQTPPPAAKTPTDIPSINRGIEAFSRGDYEECAAEMEQALRSDPDNVTAKYFLEQAGRQRQEALREQAIQETLRTAKGLFEQARYEECVRLLSEAATADPQNAEVCGLLDRAQNRLSEKEIRAVVGEYAEAIAGNGLLDFYRLWGSPDLYEGIAEDLEDMYKHYTGFRCTISDTLVRITGGNQAEVRLTIILTGSSVDDGVPKALLDGTRLWSMQRDPQGWKISSVSYMPEGTE